MTAAWFEREWLPNAGKAIAGGAVAKCGNPPEPEYWRELINDEYPGSVYARGGADEGKQWSDLTSEVQKLCIEKLPGWLRATGRAA